MDNSGRLALQASLGSEDPVPDQVRTQLVSHLGNFGIWSSALGLFTSYSLTQKCPCSVFVPPHNVV